MHNIHNLKQISAEGDRSGKIAGKAMAGFTPNPGGKGCVGQRGAEYDGSKQVSKWRDANITWTVCTTGGAILRH